MADVKWTAYGTFTQIVTNREPANAGLVASSEIDNSSAKDLFIDLEMQATFGTNPSAGGHFAAYIIQALDGTNYADGADESVSPPATAWIANFPLRAVTTAQKVTARAIAIPPGKFKIVLLNSSGQTVSTDALQLYYRAYSQAVA